MQYIWKSPSLCGILTVNFPVGYMSLEWSSPAFVSFSLDGGAQSLIVLFYLGLLWVDLPIWRIVWMWLQRSRFRAIHQLGLLPCSDEMRLQIYTKDPRTCAIFVPSWGSNCGSSGFSRNQNNPGSSGAYVTYMRCSLSMKANMLKTRAKMMYGARRPWTHLLCICLCVCGW